MEEMIKFKLTTGQHEGVELAYEPERTVGQYVEDLAELYDAPAEDFKLVFKGKILTWKDTAAKLKLQGGTVMVVLNTVKKQPKKVVPSKEQVIPGAGMNTGLGASSPFGIGGYEMVNHPQYMSAISSAVDPDKMQEMMNDPQYQGMMEQLLEDPDTLRQLINQNPMLQSMIKQNPSMKMMLENPAFLKMVLNKDMIKKTQEFMKNGGNPDNPQDVAEKFGMGMPGNAMGGMPGTAAMGGMPGMGAMGGMPGTAAMGGMPGMGAMGGMPGMGAMGQGFGGFGGGMGFNPYMYSGMMNNMNKGNAQSQVNSQPQLASSAQHATMQAAIENSFFTRVYQKQLKELQEYGFKNKQKNLSALRQSKGNVDEAMQKLCSQ